MNKIIKEIKIKKINSKQQLKEFLEQFMNYEKTFYFRMKDEYCDNPLIYVAPQYELDAGKRYTFMYDGFRWFLYNDPEEWYELNEMINKIFNLIQRNYQK